MRAAPRRAFAVAALLLAPAVHVAPVLPDPYPGAARAYLLAIGDEPRWAHAASRRLPPASLIKLLTARVLLEDPAAPGPVVLEQSFEVVHAGTVSGAGPFSDLPGGGLPVSRGAATLAMSVADTLRTSARTHSALVPLRPDSPSPQCKESPC